MLYYTILHYNTPLYYIRKGLGEAKSLLISLQIKLQHWIPLFRAYEGSGISVYNIWFSNNVNLKNYHGVSTLLAQETLWELIKQVIIRFVISSAAYHKQKISNNISFNLS